MSSIAAWTYVATITIWPVTGFDEYSQPTYGTPYTLDADWEEGGEMQTDDSGVEFVPASTYYFELALGSSSLPERGWFVKIGDHTGVSTPPNDAEKIKKVGGWNMDYFGASELPDWVLYT